MGTLTFPSSFNTWSHNSVTVRPSRSATVTMSDVIVSGDTFSFPNLNANIRVQLRLLSSSGAGILTSIYNTYSIYYNNNLLGNYAGISKTVNLSVTPTRTTSSTSFTGSAAPQNESLTQVNTQTYFNSTNPTEPTVQFQVKQSSLITGTYVGVNSTLTNSRTTTTANENLSVTLNAPPTFTASSPSFSPSNYSVIYAGYSTINVSISNLEAKYGGYITSAVLKVGNQTSTPLTGDATNILSSGTLSMLLTESGKQLVSVIVTDSRGQTTTKHLGEFTIQSYQAPAGGAEVIGRTNQNGVLKDDTDGTYGLIKVGLTCTREIASFVSPEVTVTGDNNTHTTTWYTTRNTTTQVLSNSVSWSSLSSPAIVYALVSNLNPNNNYTITITPKDSTQTTGSPLTAEIPAAFFTIDFLAGGHGITFGGPATQEGFVCQMPSVFTDNVFMQKMAGIIQMYAGSYDTVPPGWLLCDGRSLLIADYPELANALYSQDLQTYIYGTDGTDKFKLPNLDGRVPVGAGQGTATDATLHILGTSSGTETVTLTESQLPQITGSFLIRHWGSNTGTTIFGPTGKFSLTTQSTSASNIENNASNPKSAQKITYAFGGGGAHSNMQPYLVINYIICTGKIS